MTAAERFNIALITTASKGLRPHCFDVGTGDLWISEHSADRAEAALLCHSCPLLQPCDEVGQHQRFGVWGGRDVTVRAGKAAARPMKEDPDDSGFLLPRHGKKVNVADYCRALLAAISGLVALAQGM